MKAGLPGVVVLLIALFFGGRALTDGGITIPGVEGLPEVQGAPVGSEPLPGAPDPDKELVDFVSFVLDDVQGTWQQQFQRAGRRYEPPNWSCSPRRFTRRAVMRPLRWGRSTVRPIEPYTWTSASSAS